MNMFLSALMLSALEVVLVVYVLSFMRLFHNIQLFPVDVD